LRIDDIKLRNWYGKFGFILKSTRMFDHLPFVVAFMSAEIGDRNKTERS